MAGVCSYQSSCFVLCARAVPIQSVLLTSRNADASHAQSYVDGARITFVDGETRRMACQVNGSHPAATVKILVGDDDVTKQFTENTELVRSGPSNNTALQVRCIVTSPLLFCCEPRDNIIGRHSVDKSAGSEHGHIIIQLIRPRLTFNCCWCNLPFSYSTHSVGTVA